MDTWTSCTRESGRIQVMDRLRAICCPYTSAMGKGILVWGAFFADGQTSFGLAVADLNRDGHPDFITANQDSDSASVFLNDGQGGFGSPTGGYVGFISGSVPSGPVNAPRTNFISSDVNGDGSPDLVEILLGPGYPNANQAAVMLNDGSGHLGSPIYSPVAEGTFNVTDFLLGDFRNTGHPDIVTIASYFGEGGPGTQLVLAPNAGSGSFGLPRIMTISDSGALAAGDFNHDGNLDLAVGINASQSGMATITIYLGHGDGTFTAQSPITFNANSAGHWIQGLWVGDYNADGNVDILAWFYVNVVPFRNNDVYELLGKGDGTFAPAKLVLQNLSGPAIADLNHDGLPDIVDNRNPQANYPNPASAQFTIYLGQSDGSFRLTNTYAPYGAQKSFDYTLGTTAGGRNPAWLADFNGDGNIDIAAIQLETGSSTTVAFVQFLLGNGDGTFTPTYEPYYLNASFPANAFDLTGDGRADMVENDVFTSSFQVIPSGIGTPLSLQMAGDPVIREQGFRSGVVGTCFFQATQVALTTSDPAITIPATVSIPAGSLTQRVSFTIGSSFNSSHVFWIKGTLAGSRLSPTGLRP